MGLVKRSSGLNCTVSFSGVIGFIWSSFCKPFREMDPDPDPTQYDPCCKHSANSKISYP